MEGWAKFTNTIELLMDKALEYQLSWEVPSPKSLLCIAIALSVKYQITAHRLWYVAKVYHSTVCTSACVTA